MARILERADFDAIEAANGERSQGIADVEPRLVDVEFAAGVPT
jgi:hypothetical protein